MIGLPLVPMLTLVSPMNAEVQNLSVVDPLVKVFTDTPLPSGPDFVAEVARGETASWQIVMHAGAGWEGLKWTVSRLSDGAGNELSVPKLRAVGQVHADHPMDTPPKDRLRVPPCWIPDVLYPKPQDKLDAELTASVWADLKVPDRATAGEYTATVTLTGLEGGRAFTKKAKLKLVVYGVALGKPRLWVTNWFGVNSTGMAIDPKPESKEFYALMERCAKNMAAHHQNVVILSPLNMMEVRADGSYDFAQFDKWVETFIKCGVIGRIEGGHIGGRSGNWQSPFVVTVKVRENGAVTTKSVPPDSDEAIKFYSKFFPALAAHLKQRGWLDKYMQHLADEPIGANAASYRQMAELVHKYAPEFKVIEANHTKDLDGCIQVWVPELDYYKANYDHYQERLAKGEEVWFYTCCNPQGEFANRFLELPLIKTRLLHWIDYRYGATGYLHWGFNWWSKGSDPVKSSHPDDNGWPAGDRWLIYPGKDGPLDSIRWEAMRDGIADYELLAKLGKKNPELAQKLAQRLVLGFDKYETSLSVFRQTRRELLKALSQ